jgi:hypothetical protein
VHRVGLALGELGAARRLGAPLAGDPGLLAGECARERLYLADPAARLAQLDTAVERVAAVHAHVGRDGAGIGRIDAHVDGVVAADPLDERKAVGVQPAGVEDEDLDRQAGAGDRVGEHHVLGLQAVGEHGRRKLPGDATQRLLEGGVHRLRKSGTGRAGVAW